MQEIGDGPLLEWLVSKSVSVKNIESLDMRDPIDIILARVLLSDINNLYTRLITKTFHIKAIEMFERAVGIVIFF